MATREERTALPLCDDLRWEYDCCVAMAGPRKKNSTTHHDNRMGRERIITLLMLGGLALASLFFFTETYCFRKTDTALSSHQQMTPEAVTPCPPFSSCSLFRGLVDFPQSNPDCHVKTGGTRRTSLSAGKPPCSRRIFRDYFAANGRFYGSGHWTNADIKSAVFEPEGCSFLGRSFGDGSLRKYLKEQNITYMLVSGDSNGHLFAGRILKLIKKEFTTCKQTRKEKALGKSPKFDTNYFNIPNFPTHKLQGHSRGCGYCRAYVYECRYDNFTFKMEYISLTHLMDSSLRVDYSLELPFQMRRFGASTLVEFLLKYYFNHWGYPDVWAIYAPIMHETWDRDYRTFKMYADIFRQLINFYMPETSKTVVIAGHRECSADYPEDLREAMRKYHLFETRNEKIHKMNQILFNVLKPDLLDPESRILGFLDLAEISCPVMCDWHTSGAHMLMPWYDKIASYMFQFLMNDT